MEVIDRVTKHLECWSFMRLRAINRRDRSTSVSRHILYCLRDLLEPHLYQKHLFLVLVCSMIVMYSCRIRILPR
jgi:hypothetical protein